MGRGKELFRTTQTRSLQSSFPRPLGIPQTARDSHIPSATAATIYPFSTKNQNLNPGSKSVNYVPGLKCQLCPRSHTSLGQPGCGWGHGVGPCCCPGSDEIAL